MRFFYISFLLAALTLELEGDTLNQFTRVSIMRRGGVIVPSAYMRDILPESDFWTPSPRQIEEAERKLVAFLRREDRKHGSGELSQILRSPSNYRRQYIGMIEKGEKLLWINCLPAVPTQGSDPFKDWDSRMIDVSDGGSQFWGAIYNIKTHLFERLILNGSA